MRIKDIIENDAEHQKELDKTGFWGKKGAGCLLFSKSTKRFLIGKRSPYVEQPDTWGTWGGAIDSNLSPKDAVKKEVYEETGYKGNLDLIDIYVFKDPNSEFRYYNFIGVIDKEFEPTLNWESSDYAWVEYGKWPSPLHFGLKAILNDPKSVQTIKLLL